MNRFMTTTALIFTVGTAAYADGHMAAFESLQFDETTNLNASEIIGARVYATENSVDPTVMIAADGTVEWDDIGEINEIVLTRDGAVQSVIVGVGGFLGIGEKDVAIDMTQLKIVSDGEAPDEYFLVVNTNVAGIQDAPAYGMTADEETSDASDAMSNTLPMLAAPSVDRDGYETVEVEALTAEDLTGARVYGIGDEDVGEINELLLTDAGKMDRAVIDVGGFLGMGERRIAVTFGELQITRGSDGDVRVYIDNSQEALEALPVYEG